MVVSKAKKRKESPPPPPQQQQQPSAVESSPEMPKRTKVQAQRKFAQGQNAPTSYNSTLIAAAAAASSSSNTGPSTSSESREPPTEILPPNKRPKPEEFITFLCYRGTSSLPPRLDYLNQGKAKKDDMASPTGAAKSSKIAKKTTAKAANAGKLTKTAKKGKKGRPKAIAKAAVAASSTATAQSRSASASETSPAPAASPTAGNLAKKKEATSAAAAAKSKSSTESKELPLSTPARDSAVGVEDAVIPFAVRKRAEVVAEGNRRSRASDRQLRNAAADSEKCNNSVSGNKRRSNRASTKTVQPPAALNNDDNGDDDDDDEEEEEEDDEDFSHNDDIGGERGDETATASANQTPAVGASLGPAATVAKSDAAQKSKTPVPPADLKSEPPPKDGDMGRSRKGRTAAAAAATSSATSGSGAAVKKGKEALKESSAEGAKSSDSPKTVQKGAEQAPKERPLPKRSRQKESPIFIPSPEPSGRMTRQRAFFEPVKVPQRDNDTAAAAAAVTAATATMVFSKADTAESSDAAAATVKKSDVSQAAATPASAAGTTQGKETNNGKSALTGKTPLTASKRGKAESRTEDVENTKATRAEIKSNLNVFDFSSDDEQPLAKTMKLKKGAVAAGSASGPGTSVKAAPKKATQRAAKAPPAKKMPTAKKAAADKKEEKDVGAKDSAGQDATIVKEEKADECTSATAKNRMKSRAKNPKKRTEPEDSDEDKKEHMSLSPKRPPNARQSRKKATASTPKPAGDEAINGGDEENDASPAIGSAPVRAQRPSRKTKEAATIYMGIIGHKLQLADDEDDDLSLNSFPDRPCVKEMEKMEIELKKNASQSATSTTATHAAAAAPAVAARPATSPSGRKPSPATESPVTVEKPTVVRRGRPPKQGAGGKAPGAAATTGAAAATASTTTTTGTTATGGGGSGAGRAASRASGIATPLKREMEGLLVKKGALSKMSNSADSVHTKDKSEPSKVDSDDEDFLLTEEVNETKRKLEKSFSDSDDEPLAIKVCIKANEKDSAAEAAAVAASADAAKKLTLTEDGGTAEAVGEPQQNTTAALAPMLPLAAKAVPTAPPTPSTQTANATPMGVGAAQQPAIPQPPSPFKAIEKKSPVPTSKILNVPATYGMPSAANTAGQPPPPPPPNVPMNAANFGKAASYLPQPSPHYHAPHVRPPPPTLPGHQVHPGHQGHQCHQFAPTAKSPTGPAPAAPVHLQAPLPPQSPLKYQTPPTTYPPPIEAYPSPKINPNFLTPKFDRMAMPRSNNNNNNNNNFPSPSPVKFDGPNATPSKAPPAANAFMGANKTAGGPATSATPAAPPVAIAVAAGSAAPVAASAVGNAAAGVCVGPGVSVGAGAPPMAGTMPNAVIASTSTGCAPQIVANVAASTDPLKDEIGSILAANLMPSKEESGKIFGIASVSLAQSSGPDNTKCTLGKCGSIHKPVLGPVVPTEGYIGDQLSSKERRKAKVNMTHEQIQKWLIECSSNPDEIQDDLDDDYDDNLRPNLFATTPPPTRDDKESTSFSSSSKATRDMGKSESAWSVKGPSLKATAVVANRKDDGKQQDGGNQMEAIVPLMAPAADNERGGQAINLTQKAPGASPVVKQSAAGVASDPKGGKEKPERRTERKPREDKSTTAHREAAAGKDTSRREASQASGKSTVGGRQTAATTTTAAATGGDQQLQSSVETPSTSKQGRKKNAAAAAAAAAGAASTPTSAIDDKSPASHTPKGATSAASNTSSAAAASKTPKRTPVYNQKAQRQQIELKETTTTSHKKTAPFSYGAFSADNEKSIYSFDKDDDEADGSKGPGPSKALSKPAFRRQNRRDSATGEEPSNSGTTPTSRASPGKKRSPAAAAAEKANKDIANTSQTGSVSLTLSAVEHSKLLQATIDAEKAANDKAKAVTVTGKPQKGGKKQEASTTTDEQPDAAGGDADSESDGQTFYIPLQGIGVDTDAETQGDIQGVAVKLGREGPDGPNQKVIMHATLVTKGQMGTNARPLPETMNVSEIVKNLISSSAAGLSATATTTTTTITTTPQSIAPATANATEDAVNIVAIEPSANVAGVEASKKEAPTTTGEEVLAAASSSTTTNLPVAATMSRTKASAAAAAAAANDPTTSSAAAAAAAAAAASASAPPSTTATGAAAAATTATAGGTLVRVNSSSSLFSGSAKSRAGAAGPAAHAAGKKLKDDTPIKMANNTAFPRHDDPTQMVEAPIFRPTEKEFADPIEFIERITPIAARFGICKIIPPSAFKPECRISDEMRFNAYNQYVHKMLHRWGPSAKEMSAIKKYLATQSIVMNHPPWIGGMEVDLPRLYHTVQELGGLKEVIEKKKWARVAEEMCIPKLAQDRVTKLDDIYCKYLLPYDTLSPAERQKLFDEVEADWAKREACARRHADRFVNTESVSNEEDDVSSEDDEEEEEEVDGVSMECIVKGRSMPLSQFYRIARNTMALWFKNTEPTVNEVEAEFWRHVAVRDSHVCVHSGSIDSSGWGYGFPSPGPKGKGSNYARHPWNLKVLTNNPGSVLRSLGPVMGVTVPTLHVGMLFSACCWYRDPHGLSWIEYLHTGASKLWYGIPDDQSANFRSALTSLIPTHCQNKTIWLPCDTVMVPPHMLTDRGVSLCRIEQKPGEFIVIFPRAYTSSVATGYVVSESVYFATSSWLDLAKDDFRDIHDSCEPAMFSLEQLLFALGYDQRVTPDTLQQMQPMLHEVLEKETAAREQLKAAGVTSTEKVHNVKGSKAKKQQRIAPYKSIDSECDLCRANLYISMVHTEEANYCLQHALKNLNNGNIQAKQCKLIYAYNVDDIENLMKTLNEKIQQKRAVGAHKKGK